jgi:NAD(P)-dependent dehydrogenase (short-subunit alcohol dehydrogenase family)
LSESLAIEMKPFDVKVVIIEPGVIITPIWGKGEALIPEGHPYKQAMGRLIRLFGAQMDGGTMPEVVAHAIYEAVQDGATNLRYAVGADAEPLKIMAVCQHSKIGLTLAVCVKTIPRPPMLSPTQ